MEIKRMDLNEFKDLGFLHEVNRKFFHPLGLALEVIVNDEDGKVEKIGGIWDYRDDPEGMFFGEDMIDQEKIDNVEKLRKSKLFTRSLRPDFKCDLDGVQVK
jgi:hypothetical protein